MTGIGAALLTLRQTNREEQSHRYSHLTKRCFSALVLSIFKLQSRCKKIYKEHGNVQYKDKLRQCFEVSEVIAQYFSDKNEKASAEAYQKIKVKILDAVTKKHDNFWRK